MKFMRLPVVLSCLLSSLLVTAVRGDEGILTPEQVYPQLDQMLKAALAQSPRMLSRAIDLEMAENDRITARSGLLPSIGGYYNYNKTEDKRGDESQRIQLTKIYYNFSVTQPIFHWGERRNNARVGEIRKKIAEGQYREAYRMLAQEVRSQYFLLILNKLRAHKAAEYLVYARKQLQQGEERLAKKVISEAQIFGIRNDTDRAAIAADRAAFDFENVKGNLSRLTGRPALTDDEIPDTMPVIPSQEAAVQRLLAGFLAQRDPPTFEAESYRRSMQIEKYNLQNQKTRLRPKFNFVAGVSLDEQSYTLDLTNKYKVQSNYAGLSANWQLFDGFAARSGVRSSLARLRQMEFDYRALTERLAQSAQTQAKLAGFTYRSATLGDRYLESGESNVKSLRDDFTRGVIAEENFTLAQIGLYDVKVSTFSARMDYLTQLCEFLGTVVEDPVLKNLELP